MTSAVKDELARVELNKTCCRKAEVSALLRFAGGLHLVARQIVVEAELDRIIGTLFATVEAHFDELVRLGFASRFLTAE